MKMYIDTRKQIGSLNSKFLIPMDIKYLNNTNNTISIKTTASYTL